MLLSKVTLFLVPLGSLVSLVSGQVMPVCAVSLILCVPDDTFVKFSMQN